MTTSESAAADAAMRRRAAEVAAEEVESGMVLGLGTGRTAEAFLARLAERIGEGLRVVGVPTSARTAAAAEKLGIPLTDLDAHPVLDLTIDGADEVDRNLSLIKGGGGALLREKIVAAASREMLVMAERVKFVETLGAFPLPIEIVPFGARATIAHIEKAFVRCGVDGALNVRRAGEGPFVTDGGHHIVDASLGRIPDPEALAGELAPIPGVVEHGLFVNIATKAIIGDATGVERLTAPAG